MELDVMNSESHASARACIVCRQRSRATARAEAECGRRSRTTPARRSSRAGCPSASSSGTAVRSGPRDGPGTVIVRSPTAVKRMLWAPGELGLGRAYVTGELDRPKGT